MVVAEFGDFTDAMSFLSMKREGKYYEAYGYENKQHKKHPKEFGHLL